MPETPSEVDRGARTLEIHEVPSAPAATASARPVAPASRLGLVLPMVGCLALGVVLGRLGDPPRARPAPPPEETGKVAAARQTGDVASQGEPEADAAEADPGRETEAQRSARIRTLMAKLKRDAEERASKRRPAGASTNRVLAKGPEEAPPLAEAYLARVEALSDAERQALDEALLGP